jgi:hypothetical protein
MTKIWAVPIVRNYSYFFLQTYPQAERYKIQRARALSQFRP